MRRALSEYAILGVTTNLPLLRRIVDSDGFAAGDTDTAFLTRLPAVETRRPPAEAIAAAAAAQGSSPAAAAAAGPWSETGGWRNR